MSTLGIKVRELRERRGLTQVELAVAIDMSLTAIRAIESRGQEPNLGTLRKLKKLFGVSYDVLINEDDPVAVRAALDQEIRAAGAAAARGSAEASLEQKRLLRQAAMLDTRRAIRGEQEELFAAAPRRAGGKRKR